MDAFRNKEDLFSYLDAIPKFSERGAGAANFSLDAITACCDEMGNPQDHFPAIHVAGTNGKGTTCHLLEYIYRQAGYKTGLFTSPHLLRYNERVRVNGKEISDEALLKFFNRYRPLLEKHKLTYFEISTVLAFQHFMEQKVDLAIIETGLGGRLDSTNIIRPVLSVITSIGMDHQDILGDTPAEIAKEKAGIIKEQVPVVTGNITGEARAVIGKVAEMQKAEVLDATGFSPGWAQGEVYWKEEDRIMRIQTSLSEALNRWNVVMARLAVLVLNRSFPVSIQKFRKAIETFAGVPGRFEKLHPDFEWYFSGAHNIQALQSVLETVKAKDAGEEAVAVLSFMKDKITPEVAAAFKDFKRLCFVRAEGERAASDADIRPLMEVEIMDENNQSTILKELQTELVIFTGSFYFYPIVKRWVNKI